MFKKKDGLKTEGNFIDIEAGMEGNLKFSTPVNLKINGKFSGTLETKGVLIIGEKADVNAKIIKGENITILGKVQGDIVTSKHLLLSASARVAGNVKASILAIEGGAMLKGHCQVPAEDVRHEHKESPGKKKKK